ncbi:MAG TPA: YceI family protein [Rickettsiales bacterium]|nr:YceI family protein [Rickettsiales bacterium]
MRKKQIVFLTLPFLFASAALAGPEKYNIDKSHTHIVFLVNHLEFSNTIGRITDYDGYFTFDPKEPEKSEIDVTLKSASVATDVPDLDKELRGDKFLNTEKFPTMHFKSTKITVTDKQKGDVEGELTMLGVTKPVTMQVVYNKSGINPYSNNYESGFSADIKLKRSDFGMNAYLPAVGDEVRVHLEVEGINPFKHPGNAKTPN